MGRVRGGDPAAFAELYDRHTDSLLFPVALRILGDRAEAEEAVQEAWIQVWRTAVAYDAARATVAGWLLTITRSRALDRLRASKRLGAVSVDAPGEVGIEPAQPQAVDSGRRERQVRAALGRLDAHHRQVLEIAYFEGLSQTRIAQRLQAPLGTVKSWTRQGLSHLRSLLEAEGAS